MGNSGKLTAKQNDILRGSGWLSTRSLAVKDAFLELGALKALEIGQVLYPRGKAPTHVHGLIRGQIDVQLLAPNNDELAFPSGQQSKWYSFSDVITNEPAMGFAIARQPSELLSISRRELMHFLNADPRRYIDIIAHDNALRRQMQEVIAEIVTGDGVELVARRLAWMADNDRLDADNSVAISQLDFALAAGVSAPIVRRAFRDMRRRGILETYYGKIVIRDAEELRHLADKLGAG
ncbi:Crp/Fnr family transcriptional regulator [Phaeobacter marinintestinus]|uniref:Crp/Fnr family transcriptional regulator n=1 Tax=Falsiphaeobacter marinintestinus TaxID=1492905 RepID=UPI0011B63941|nr:helix-turn-helix domain-containing protein [Phaeobacter marinintestinus]